MSKEVAWFMIYITEQIANRLFDSRQDLAYSTMKATGFWDYLRDTYATSHCLSSAQLCDEAKDWFASRGATV